MWGVAGAKSLLSRVAGGVQAAASAMAGILGSGSAGGNNQPAGAGGARPADDPACH